MGLNFKNVNDVIWKPEVKGDTLTGLLKSMGPWNPPEGTKKKGKVNQYLIESANGVDYTMIGGTVLDKLVTEESKKNLGREIASGDLVRFIYQGKKTSKEGDQYHSWGVQCIPAEEVPDDWRDHV